MELTKERAIQFRERRTPIWVWVVGIPLAIIGGVLVLCLIPLYVLGILSVLGVRYAHTGIRRIEFNIRIKIFGYNKALEWLHKQFDKAIASEFKPAPLDNPHKAQIKEVEYETH